MFAFIESLLEALYVYQTSFYFTLHLLLVIAGILLILYLFLLEFRIRARDAEPVQSKCSEKVDYFNYVVNKQKNTEEAVLKLQESEEYKQYLRERDHPNSRFNRH
jgi:hypothetical protein